MVNRRGSAAVTKADLETLGKSIVGHMDAKIDCKIDGLRTVLSGEIGGLRTELMGEIGGLRTELMGEIGGLRTELMGEIGSLKADVGSLKADVGSLKADVGGLMADVGGLKADVGGLKADVGGLKADVKDLTVTTRNTAIVVAGHTEEFVRLNKKLAKLDEFDSLKKSLEVFTSEIIASRHERTLMGKGFFDQQATLTDHELRLTRIELRGKQT